MKNGELNPYDSVYYHYDSKGQLSRIDDKGGSTQTYTYDSHGNVTKVKSYPYTTGELQNNPSEVDTFRYEEADPWPDKLAGISGGLNEIVYDENGNPISLDDAIVKWTNGRQLESINDVDENGNEVPFVSYTYDDNGIRTSKTFGDTTTYYTNIDGNVTSQYQLDENGNIINLAEFIYDSSNDVIGFTYEGETYFYLKNLQNDVLGVIDSNGELMAEYYYSTWGWHTGWESDDSDIYDVNPFRYRSYIYDEEMSMCYLQSRYYITTFGRFLNSDLPEYAQMQKGDTAGLNLFAYCNNDPVNNCDPFGTWKLPIWAKATIGVFALAGAIGLTLLSGCSLAPLLISVAISTASGAIIGYFKNGKQGVIDGAWDGFMWGSIFGLSSSAINAIRVAKVGTEFGKLGKLTTYRNTKISSYTNHGYVRIKERGISESTLKSIIKNGKVLVQTAGDGGTKYAYVAKKGVVVITPRGEVITAYLKCDYDPVMQEVIKKLF